MHLFVGKLTWNALFAEMAHARTADGLAAFLRLPPGRILGVRFRNKQRAQAQRFSAGAPRVVTRCHSWGISLLFLVALTGIEGVFSAFLVSPISCGNGNRRNHRVRRNLRRFVQTGTPDLRQWFSVP